MKSRDALKYLDMTVHGMEAVQALTHVGGAKAEATLAAISAAVAAVQAGHAGKLTAAEVTAELDALVSKLAANDAGADAALAAKFGDARD